MTSYKIELCLGSFLSNTTADHRTEVKAYLLVAKYDHMLKIMLAKKLSTK